MVTSIIILTHNKLDYTKQCIESIRRYTPPGSYELIVVDNRSTDGTVDWLSGQEDIKKILNNENMGFPKGCNQGIEIASGDNILLLNNDTVVTHQWLSNLVNCLYSADDIGAVGPVTNNCSNLQTVEVKYTNIEEMHGFAKEYNIPDSKKWEIRPRLVGFCLLIRRKVTDQIGLLDERFSPGNYEDDDYCLRIRMAGYKFVLCRDTFIHHYGSTSFGENRQQFLSLLETNRKKFEEKWGLNTMQNAAKEEPVNYYIDPSCDIRGKEKIKLGSNVVIQKDCWLNIAYNNPDRDIMIEVGDGSNIGRRSNISAANRIIIGKNVLTAPNVHITDHNHEYKQMGIPIINQGIDSFQNEIVIGEGSWLGINSVVVGNVHIGKGCVIGANSVANRDVPDYCVVAGNPAKIVKMLDMESGEWIKVKNKGHLKELLVKREKNEPLLSICIATYNRADNLDICLHSIYCQIGNDGNFEVVISDNASTDSTELIVNKYERLYNNLKYSKNEQNIGAERNILKSIEKSRGKYVLLHGDDDYFKDDTLYAVLNVINQSRQNGLFFLNVLNDSKQVSFLQGMDNYLSVTSIYSTFISSIIFQRSEYDKIDDPAKFIDKRINHVYLQYRILQNNPNFCVINNSAFTYASNNPGGYSFAEVFIKNYFNILYYFTDKGLSADLIRTDKEKILGPMIFYWYKRILDYNIHLDISNFDEIFTEYYKEEPYFEAACNIIKNIRENSKKG